MMEEAAPPFPCQWQGCASRFDEVEAYYDHLCNDHVGKGRGLELVCRFGDSCGLRYNKRDHLTSHLRIHVPLKPHSCPVCARAFKRPQDLKKHEKLHDGGAGAGGVGTDPAAASISADATAASLKAHRRNLVKMAMPGIKKENLPSSSFTTSKGVDSASTVYNAGTSSPMIHPPQSPAESNYSMYSESANSVLTGSVAGTSKKRRASSEVPPFQGDMISAQDGGGGNRLAVNTVNRFFEDIKRNRFSPISATDSTGEPPFELETLSNMLVTTPPPLSTPSSFGSPSIKTSTPPPHPPRTLFVPLDMPRLDSFTNADLVSIDDFLNSVSAAFDAPAKSYGLGGNLTGGGSAQKSGCGANSVFNPFMFQNPAAPAIFPGFQQHQHQHQNQHQHQQTSIPSQQNNNAHFFHQTARQDQQHDIYPLLQPQNQYSSFGSGQPYSSFYSSSLASAAAMTLPPQLPRIVQTSTPQMRAPTQSVQENRQSLPVPPALPSFKETLMNLHNIVSEDAMDVDGSGLFPGAVDVTLPVPPPPPSIQSQPPLAHRRSTHGIVLPPPPGMMPTTVSATSLVPPPLVIQQFDRRKAVLNALKEVVRREMELRVDRQLRGF